MKLTEAQQAQFDDEGYLFLPGLFSTEEVAVMKGEIPAIFAERRPENVREKTGDVVRTAFATHTYNEVYRRLVRHPRIIEPAKELLDGDVYVHQFKLNGKALTPDPRKTQSFYGGIVSYTASRGGLASRINTHYWFEMDVPLDVLRQGDNLVEVTLDRHFKALQDDRMLVQAEIIVQYYEPPIPVGGQM